MGQEAEFDVFGRPAIRRERGELGRRWPTTAMNLNLEQGMQTDMDVDRVMNDAQARELVLRVVAQHADSLLRTPRRHSLCADDAQDAYQRTMEIFVRRAGTLDPDRAYKWVHTVSNHHIDTLKVSAAAGG